MTDYVNECVGCDYCVNCGKRHTEVTRCDECGEICEVVYISNRRELCGGCVEQEMWKAWKELTTKEKLKLLGVDEDEFNSAISADVAANDYFDDMSLEDKIDLIQEVD